MVGKWVVALAALVLAAQGLAAISASVDRSVVEEGSTFRLTIESDGAAVTPEALDVLRTDFRITGTREASSFTFLNGVQSVSKKVFVTLLPNRTGKLDIPSIEVGDDRTDPISITVIGLSSELRQRISEHAFIEIEAEPRSQFVQAPIRVVRRLYYSASAKIASSLPSLDNLPETRVIVTQADQTTNAELDGRSYNVVSQAFTIYPEKSGALVLPSFTVRVYLRSPDMRRQFQERRITSEPVHLDVLPIPDAYPPDQPWFPAYDIEMDRMLDPEDLSAVEVGATIRDEVSLVAVGLYGAAIPPISYRVPDGVRIYVDSPRTADGVRDGESVGNYFQNTNIVVTKPGEWVIDPVEITWWNLSEQRVDQVLLPEIRIATKVAPPIGEARAQPPSSPNESPGFSQDSNPEPRARETAGTPASSAIAHDGSWLLLAGVGVAGALLGAMAAVLIGRLDLPTSPKRGDAQRTPSARKFASRLQNADPAAKKRLLVDWVAANLEVDALTASRVIRSDSEGEAILRSLNSAIYGRGSTQSDVSAAQIIPFAQELLKTARSKSVLVPGLYEIQPAS
ncbi:MAG: BatD family protein [Pseudomonadales bacterium]|nr:BatD family protein [Pseudomonadales bacterium]